jgi:hypothetical protein
LKTTLVVVSLASDASSQIKISNPALLLTLEIATYNLPNTGLGKYNPTKSSDWPCDFLIVIA